MKIAEIATLLEAGTPQGHVQGDRDLTTVYAGDMLSDVLALGGQPDVLLTGLVNPQVIRTAEMLDTACVVFLRGKAPTEQILALADSCGVCVLTAGKEMYEACGLLYGAGLRPAQ